MSTPDSPIQPPTLAGWRHWLAQHYAVEAGVWLVVHQEGSGTQSYSIDDAVEEALCFGWIARDPLEMDDERSMLWFTPREPKAGWRNLARPESWRMRKATI